MRAVNVADLRLAARRRLPRAVFDYIDGGADAEWTLRENSRAFDDVTFRPRSAVATKSCELRTTVLGEGMLIGDDVARVCPPQSALNGIPGCNLIGDSPATPNQSFTARSKHPGGVHASLSDGSVRFFSNTINLATWRALSTSKGGEVIDSSDL